MAEDPVYLDYNATTPIGPEATAAMLPLLAEGRCWANPSSTHAQGKAARQAVERARAQVAGLLNCGSSTEVLFTSGGTESNNTALRCVGASRLIVSAVEHPAVAQVARHAARTAGVDVVVLPVDGAGLLRLDALEKALRLPAPADGGKVLVSVMHANNEVGTVQPIAAIAKLAHAHGALCHTDAAQSAGKISVDVQQLGVDMLSLAGHKLYAPKGVGALFLRRGAVVLRDKLMLGADHESDRRAGTENVLEIVGLGAACEAARLRLAENAAHMKAMRDRLHDAIASALGPELVRFNGHPEERLPNTLSLSFRGIHAATILADVADAVSASAGAACHAADSDAGAAAGQVVVSDTLRAMEVPLDFAMGTIRFSVGRMTTEAEIDRAASAVIAAVRRLAGDHPAADAAKAEDSGAVRLTQMTHGMGCACKLRPQDLESVLAALAASPNAARHDPNLLVGTETSDDAAVYKISDTQALVLTVDFFTPVCDDPRDFGRVAAANSLSDVYAMGAKPLTCLSVVGFPSGRLPLSVLEQIIRGATEVCAEAGISIVGGHTVEDTEPKFGLSVVGVVNPNAVMRNSGCKVGDVLVLTKPLGLGVISTAVKRGLASPELARQAVELMATLNKTACEAMVEIGASACTDVTGFGLLGHLRGMVIGSKVSAVVQASKVPVIPGTLEFIAAGTVPGGTLSNMDYVASAVSFDETVSREDRILLCDAQTSGGLLISIPEQKASALIAALRAKKVAAAEIIGRIEESPAGRIHVVN